MRQGWGGALVAVLGVLLGALAGAGAAEGCTARPRIEVETVADRVEYRYDTPMAMITQLAARGDGGVALGLSQSMIGIESHMETSFAQSGHRLCGTIHSVTIRLRLMERVVHVAREAGADRCLFDEVLAHERRHVAVDEAFLTEAARIAHAELERRGRNYVAFDGATPQALNAELDRMFGADLERISDRLTRLRLQRQAAVDSPQEDARMRRVCDGAAARIVGGY